MMRLARAACFLLCLFVVVSLAGAFGTREAEVVTVGDVPAVGSYPVPVLLFFSWSGGQKDLEQLDVLRRSAAAAFASQRPDARILLQADIPADLRLASKERDAVGWIEILVTDDGLQLEITASAHAVAALTPAFEIRYTELSGLTLPNLGRIWLRAADRFQETWPDLVERATSDVRYTEVTVHAVPGTRLSGLGGIDRVVPESGELRAEVISPLVYTLRTRARQHYPTETIVLVLEDDVEVSLRQPPRSAFSYDFGLANFSYPSLDVSRRIAGDYLYARLGLTTYLLGIVPFADNDRYRVDDEQEKVFYAEDMTEFRAQFGSYLISPHAPARAYLSTGAVWRLIHTRGFWGGDPVAPWGLVTTIGVETQPSARWRLFLEWRPTLYPTDYPELLMQVLPGAAHIWGPETSDAGIGADAGTRRSTSWILAGAEMRVGVRWQP
jgi:hypothetical protein